MPNSPFANSIFRHATFTFKVADTDYVIDDRGNKRSIGRSLAVTFALRSSGGNARKQDVGAIASSSYQATVLAVNDVPTKIIPIGIKPGDVGEGEIDGRRCIAKVENIGQSSVTVVPKVLGEKAQLTITYQSREGVSV